MPGHPAAEAANVARLLPHQVAAEVLHGACHRHFTPFQGAFSIARQAVVGVDQHEDPVAEPAVDNDGADVDDLHPCTCPDGSVCPDGAACPDGPVCPGVP